MELHPWANAQHPSHHHYNHLQRQPLGLPRSNTPLQTPAAQRRLNDLNVPQGSASTIAEPHSSSAAQTPVTGEPAARVVRTIQDENNGSSTPSKPMLTPANNLATNSTLQVVAAADQAKASQIGSGVRFRPLPATRIPSQRHHSILDAALKSTKATTSSGTSIVSAVPPSNPNRYPPVKAEDALLHSHQKSTLQYHHPSVAPNTPLNGQVDRIGA